MTPERGNGDSHTSLFVRVSRWLLGIGYERNVGGPERTTRYLLGFVALALAIGFVLSPVFESAILNSLVALASLVIGLFLIYEARTRYCPVNHSLSRSTHKEP